MKRFLLVALAFSLFLVACEVEKVREPSATPLATNTITSPPTPNPTSIPTPNGGGMGKLLYIKNIRQIGSATEYISNIFIYDFVLKIESQVTSNTTGIETFQYSDVDQSPDGKKLVFCATSKTINLESSEYYWNSLLYTSNLDGSDMKMVSQVPQFNGDFSGSDVLRECKPTFIDNENILFVSNRNNLSNFIDEPRRPYIMNLESLEISVPFSTDIDVTFLSISPDKTKIAFSAWNDDFDIFIADMKNNGAISQLTDNTFTDTYPSFSSDNQWIAFHSNRDGNFELYVMKSDGSEIRRITTNTAIDASASWSPDQNWLAFYSDQTGVKQVFIQHLLTVERIQITDGENPVTFIRWSQ